MQVSRPNAKELSPQELQDLAKLKGLIERAVADGKISKQELEDIQAQTFADGKVLVEELDLYRKLVTEKIERGELEYEF
ncbi:MAG: hypothetical protein ACM37W_10880 [Actinomycetota bacterium]